MKDEEKGSDMRRWMLGLAIPLALSGCDGALSVSGLSKALGGGGLSLNGGPTTTLSGTAYGPSTLVGNNASALVANNVGNLISNSSNALVSNNVGGLAAPTGLVGAFGVLSLSPEVPLPGVQVALLTLSGTVAATGNTDSSGHFSLPAPDGSYVVEAAYEVGQTTVREDNLALGQGSVQVDTASTLAIDALQSAAGSLLGYSASDVNSVISAVQGSLTDTAAQSLAGTTAARVAAFQQLSSSSPQLLSAYQTAVADRQSQLGSGSSTSSGSSSSSGTTSTSSSSSTSSSGSGSTSSSTSSSGATPTLALSSFASAPGFTLGTDSVTGQQELTVSNTGSTSMTVALPQGQILRFDLSVSGVQANPTSGYPVYLEMLDSSGSKLSVAALYDANAGIPAGTTACGAGTPQQGTTVECAATDNESIEFNLTVPANVASLVFGGTGTSFTGGLEQIQLLAN